MSLIVDKCDRVTTIAIDRPQRRNAIDPATADALAFAFEAFDEDPDSDVAVLYGNGGTFCAGYDLVSFATSPESVRLEETGNGPMGPTRMLLSKPVIAAVSGYAVAGGMELALWCDLRVVERSAIFGVYCRRFGVPLIDGGTIRLTRTVGHSRALDLILTGRAVASDEAERIGLANRVVPDGTALAQAQQLAREIAQFPQNCVRSDRRSVYEQWGLSMEGALRNEFRHGAATIASGESFEGARRFARLPDS